MTVFISRRSPQVAGAPEQVEQIALRVGPSLPGTAGPRVRDELQARRQFRATQPEGLAEQALETAAPDGSAHLRAHGEAESRPLLGRADAMPKDEVSSDGFRALLENLLKLLAVLQPRAGSEAGRLDQGCL